MQFGATNFLLAIVLLQWEDDRFVLLPFKV